MEASTIPPKAKQKLTTTLDWLADQGVDIAAITTERRLYVGIARAHGANIPDGQLPESRKTVARAIRHYARTGELIALETHEGVDDQPAQNKSLIRHRLLQCFEVGDVGASRPGLLADALQHDRPTRITLLFEQQSGRCYYCNKPMLLAKADKHSPRFATLDHVHPKCRGGIRSADNAVAACASCNFEKAHTDYDRFQAQRAVGYATGAWWRYADC